MVGFKGQNNAVVGILGTVVKYAGGQTLTKQMTETIDYRASVERIVEKIRSIMNMDSHHCHGNDFNQIVLTWVCCKLI